MNRKKIISAVMAAVMVFGCAVSSGAFAGEQFVISASAESPTSGSCGKQACFVLDEEGTLTISGNGVMYNWHWDDTKVKKLVINEGIDYVSYRHFKYAPILESVKLPSSMRTLRAECFGGCGELTNVNLPSGITDIESSAFQGCKKLTEVTIKSKDVNIGDYALGYLEEKDSEGNYLKVEGFTIKGLSGSTAEKYAKDNGFNFVSIDFREEVRGDANNDKVIDIEDAVMVINHVNGQSALDDAEQYRADIDGAGVIDIEDAVNIISHINGQKAISPATVKIGTDDIKEDPVKTVSVTFTNTGEVLTMPSTGVILTDYGRGTDPANTETYNEASWYLKALGEGQDIGNLDIVCDSTGISLQEYITSCIPVTEDLSFTAVYNEPSGQRTMELFEKMLDNNYSLKMSGTAAVLLNSGPISAEIKQKDENNGFCEAHANLSGLNVDVLTYTVDGTTYYIRDEANKKYSTTPGFVERNLDMKKIFQSIAKNKDSMEFLGERKDEETGCIIESFKTDITDPIEVENATVDAYYDASGNITKLVIMSEDFDPEEPEYSELYICSDTFKVDTELSEEINFPNFSEWTQE